MDETFELKAKEEKPGLILNIYEHRGGHAMICATPMATVSFFTNNGKQFANYEITKERTGEEMADNVENHEQFIREQVQYINERR